MTNLRKHSLVQVKALVRGIPELVKLWDAGEGFPARAAVEAIVASGAKKLAGRPRTELAALAAASVIEFAEDDSPIHLAMFIFIIDAYAELGGTSRDAIDLDVLAREAIHWQNDQPDTVEELEAKLSVEQQFRDASAKQAGAVH